MPRGRKCAALPNLVPACASGRKVFRKIFPPSTGYPPCFFDSTMRSRVAPCARTMWLRTRTGWFSHSQQD